MFSPDTLFFLAENRFNNSREWFNEHRADYNRLVFEPLRDLAVALAPTVTEIDEEIVTIPAVDKAISRIWCDLRFSKGKMLFRDSQWISFRRYKKEYPGWPEFFFVVTANSFFYGCGYYCTSPDTMAAVRHLIMEDHPKFRTAKKDLEALPEVELTGEKYKRTKFPQYSLELQNWLDRKTLCFMYKANDINELYAPDLAQKVKQVYQKLAPVYKFLTYAENYARDHKE